MARYGFGNVKVEFDNASDVLVDMSQHVTEIDGLDREALMAEITAAGDVNERHAPVGVRRMAQVTLRGPYDDTAGTGPDAIFNAIGNTTTRTLKVTFGGTKTLSVETVIVNYRRNLSRGALTMYEVVLQPTGAVTET